MSMKMGLSRKILPPCATDSHKCAVLAKWYRPQPDATMQHLQISAVL